ncbi:MAG: hypothetical protein K0Q80_1929 [Microvirga sp.]|nr:hypothetical protein [Microvirga sp.]
MSLRPTSVRSCPLEKGDLPGTGDHDHADVIILLSLDECVKKRLFHRFVESISLRFIRNRDDHHAPKALSQNFAHCSSSSLACCRSESAIGQWRERVSHLKIVRYDTLQLSPPARQTTDPG